MGTLAVRSAKPGPQPWTWSSSSVLSGPVLLRFWCHSLHPNGGNTGVRHCDCYTKSVSLESRVWANSLVDVCSSFQYW